MFLHVQMRRAALTSSPAPTASAFSSAGSAITTTTAVTAAMSSTVRSRPARPSTSSPAPSATTPTVSPPDGVVTETLTVRMSLMKRYTNGCFMLEMNYFEV